MTPATIGVGEALVHAVEAATHAPSPHNTQPWIFSCDGTRVAVLLDRERVLGVADPEAREARMSCGAAVFIMRIALSAAGYRPEIELLPDRARPDLLAVVRAGPRRRVPPVDLAFAKAVSARRSHRRPFDDRPVPAWARKRLADAAIAEGARLLVLDRPSDLEAVAALVRRAEQQQSEDPVFQEELAAWTTQRDGRDDGVPAVAGGPRPEADAFLPLRRYGSGAGGAERPYEHTPVVGVFASYTDTPLAQVRCGGALQRVLLTAVMDGLSASFLSQPVEVASTRTALRELLGDGTVPQTVLRFGYGFTAPATPRRAVDKVLRRVDGA